MFQNINPSTQPFWFDELLHVAGAVAIFLAGRWLAKLGQRSIRAVMKKSRTTPALAEILARGTYYAILILAISLALIILGIPANVILGTLAIIIVVAAVALRESLRDLAATVTFVIFQPFKIGDMIETNGITGKVDEILILTTVIISPDNKQIIIPNGNIQSNTLVNLSALDKVRIDFTVRLSYADSLQQVKDTLLEIARSDTRVMENPAPFVQLTAMGDSHVEYVLRAYTTPTDSWAVRPALNEQIKFCMEQRTISLPFPQLQVNGSLPN